MSAEDRLIRKMERAGEKPSRDARLAQLDEMARRAVAVPFDSRADALAFLRLVVGHAFTRLCRTDTRHETRAFFGRLASGDDLHGLVRSAAWAEAQWAKATAANDEGAK